MHFFHSISLEFFFPFCFALVFKAPIFYVILHIFNIYYNHLYIDFNRFPSKWIDKKVIFFFVTFFVCSPRLVIFHFLKLSKCCSVARKKNGNFFLFSAYLEDLALKPVNNWTCYVCKNILLWMLCVGVRRNIKFNERRSKNNSDFSQFTLIILSNKRYIFSRTLFATIFRR